MMGRIKQIGIKFWNWIIEIEKRKKKLNWRNIRMHQFLGSEMMKMERCKDEKMEKRVWASSMEIQRCRIGFRNELQWKDEKMQQWKKEFEHLQWRFWDAKIEFINKLWCRDAKNKINLNDITIKRNGQKNKRGYGMLVNWNEKKIKKYRETKEIRHFLMKMKTWFKVIANSIEKKNKKSNNEGIRKKKDQGRVYQERNEQTLFANYIDENNIVSKSKEWKKRKKDLKQI